MITLVMPAYNEAELIEDTVRTWHQEVLSKIPGSEMIVVDDCSTDSTGEILDRLAAEIPPLRVVRTPRNSGHGPALRLGFRHVTQDYVFQTDSDQQHLPSDFWRLWEARDDADFVFGVRRERADGASRVFITSAMRLFNLLLWGLWIDDANCPFKLMRRQAVERVLFVIPEDSFIPMVMISLLARKMGFKIREVAVTHLGRKGGHQSLEGLAKWARVSVLCLHQLLRLRLTWKRRAGRAG